MSYIWVTVLVIGVHLLISNSNGQTTEDDKNAKSNFLIPKQINSMIDSFRLLDREYIIVNFDMNYAESGTYCRAQFGARLSNVDTKEKALFLAEALSETNHAFDSLWLGARKVGEVWKWVSDDNNKVNVSEELLDEYYMKRENETAFGVARLCLAFQRKYHDLPQYLSLPCSNKRSPICDRSIFQSPNDTGSIHPGWIRIGKRDYKIFQDRVAYENASINCKRIDVTANLAVVVSFEDAQQLGRYLLIGRPSLENAWIGGKYLEKQYVFETEDLTLPDETNETSKYPPWRPHVTTRKAGGCLLLDRHLSNTTYFVEAFCDRYRPYICYKMASGPPTSDLPNYGMRVIYDPASWKDATQNCGSFPVKGKLVQPQDETGMQQVLFAMGENTTALQHIWVGGVFEEGKWKWVGGDFIQPGSGSGYPPWVFNETYTDDVENMNTCLNFDRINHAIGLFYGTDCTYRQSYICWWSPEEFPKLLEMEAEKALKGIEQQQEQGDKNTEAPKPEGKK